MLQAAVVTAALLALHQGLALPAAPCAAAVVLVGCGNYLLDHQAAPDAV